MSIGDFRESLTQAMLVGATLVGRLGVSPPKKVVELGFPSGIICSHWNDTEKISMAPAQGRHAQIEKRKQFVCYVQKGRGAHRAAQRRRLPGGGQGAGAATACRNSP